MEICLMIMIKLIKLCNIKNGKLDNFIELKNIVNKNTKYKNKKLSLKEEENLLIKRESDKIKN